MSRRSSAIQPAEFNPPVGQSSTTTSSALQKVCCRPQASIPTLNRLIDASPAYQHGVLLPRRHAVELREHRPRQRLDGPGAWARHRRGRHRRRPLRCPRQVVSRVSRERSRARAAGCARRASQGATGGPEAGSGGVGPAGRWSPVVPGPIGVLGSTLSGAMLAASVFFTAENFTVNKLFTPRV